jgi:N-methylhydantoinase B
MTGSAQVTLITDRRESVPYGLAGGAPGASGRNWLVRDGQERSLPGRVTLRCQAGDRIRIETPGGGGWGKPASNDDAKTCAEE